MNIVEKPYTRKFTIFVTPILLIEMIKEINLGAIIAYYLAVNGYFVLDIKELHLTMSKNRVKILCPGLLALVLVAPAHAALYDVVDHGTYFTDTSTDGLNWLDLTTTYGKSFNEVSSGFEPGGQYEGYRYATVNEFGTMIESVTGIDLANTGQGTLENFPGEVFDDLMAIIDARNYSAATRIYAMFGDLSNGKQVNVLIRDYDNPNWNDDYNTRNAVTQSWMSENLGSLLVQTPSPVPIPAAFWLLGSGLLGLAGVAKRRKADSCD